MRTLNKSDTKLEKFLIRDQTFHKKEKTNSLITLIDIKFYQKSFVLLIALFTFLIFPESPRELESVCNSYQFESICNVW
tara:strand:+ start:422 stop:658 length:237 start_codon:yes stop_codon:yes gene_type:complete